MKLITAVMLVIIAALALPSSAAGQSAMIQTRYLGGTQSPASWTVVEIPSAPWVLRYQTMSGTYVADAPAYFSSSWWSVDVGREVGSFADSTAIAYVGYLEVSHVPLGPTGGGLSYSGFMVGVRGTMPMPDERLSFVYDFAFKPVNAFVGDLGSSSSFGTDITIGVRYVLSETVSVEAGYTDREWHNLGADCSWPGDTGWCVWSGPYLGVQVSLP